METFAISSNIAASNPGPTGPRTPEGKMRVRFNATKHGLDSARVVVGDEDLSVFGAYRAQLFSEWQPVGLDERALIERMAAANWRQQRMWGVETDVYNIWCDPTETRTPFAVTAFMREREDSADTLERCSRAQFQLDRTFDLALRRLLLLQDLRRKGLRPGVKDAPIETAAEVPASPWIDNPIAEIAEQTPPTVPVPTVVTSPPVEAVPSPGPQLGLGEGGQRPDEDAPSARGSNDAPTPPTPSFITPIVEIAERTPTVLEPAVSPVSAPRISGAVPLRTSGAILAAALADPDALERAEQPPEGLTDHDRRRWRMVKRHPETPKERKERISTKLAYLRTLPAKDLAGHQDEFEELLRQVVMLNAA